MANAITTYLSALPNTGDELVARLRARRAVSLSWPDACLTAIDQEHHLTREAADAIVSLTARAQAAEASLASAREALERIVVADTTPLYRALETVPYRTEIGRAGKIAADAIRALKEVR